MKDRLKIDQLWSAVLKARSSVFQAGAQKGIRLGRFWSILITLIIVYIVLKWFIPLVSRWLTGLPFPLQVPSTLMLFYMVLTILALYAYISFSKERLEEFLTPIRRLLLGMYGSRTRTIVLAVIPLLFGWQIYSITVPKVSSPTALRIQHPSSNFPKDMEALKNPLMTPGDSEVDKFIEEVKGNDVQFIPEAMGEIEKVRDKYENILGFIPTESVQSFLKELKTGNINREKARQALREKYLFEGRILYAMNCRPCHGDSTAGDGPMADGFRLRPINFTENGTIETIVEGYTFWRISTGGRGLPQEATPWDSAMPVWNADIPEEYRWRIIMAEYDLAQKTPRQPEKLAEAVSQIPLNPPLLKGEKGGLRGSEGGFAHAADVPSGKKLAKSPDAIDEGKLIYFKRCSFCHGLEGDGDGPAAYQLIPRPRDFTKGLYKFRSTGSGELPTDEDLFRVISHGLPGTAMQSFDSDRIKSGLTEVERWQVIYYIQTFAEDFGDPEFDPYKAVVKVAPEIKPTSESIEKGKKIFEEMKCWECHGDNGRGNGPNSSRLKDKFRGDPILPFDLTKGWRYKGGNTPRDVYMRFNTGINGTPMPSFTDSLSDEERWHLANFVVSLQKREVNNEPVLRAIPVNGDIPIDHDNPAWGGAPSIDILMAGQVILRPRWENPSVDLITVRAMYNDKEIAFLMEWGDRFKDTVHNPDVEYKVPGVYKGYVSWEEIPRDIGNLRDSIALQFPRIIPEGIKKPHFFRGDPGNPVNLWVWKSDAEESGQPSVEVANASGPNQPVQVLPPEGQLVKGKGVWNGGVWKVVMKRSLVTDDKNVIQFEKGKFIPLSLNVWDGSNGEHNLLMSLSSWHYVILESPTPVKVYLYALFGIVGIGLGEFWLVRRVRKG